MTFVETFWHLIQSIGLYVIIGLVFVGILHLYISEEWIQKHLGQESRYSALKGALFGIPLPLCSCGVIPLATSLYKKGASKSAVTSFFITTPMTGIDSIIATYGVFGLPMALFRVISSFISGVLAGILVGDKQEHVKEIPQESHSCCSGSCDTLHKKVESSFKRASDYALNEVFSDLAKPMFYGLLLASAFIVFVPKEMMMQLSSYWFISYFLVLLLSLPMYVCSVSAIPIALGLLAAGASPGTAFIFLAAAPATNIITAGIIKQILGNRVLLIYLLSIIATTLGFAMMIDFVFPQEWFSLTYSASQEEHSILHLIFGVVFLLLMGYYFLKGFKERYM
jgi:uncharacterized membrane protein YraQ (UPF0718 family)